LKIQTPIDPKKLRRSAYMPIGDQLDSVIKTFSHLHKQGIDIGAEGRELVEHSEWVKDKFAKK